MSFEARVWCENGDLLGYAVVEPHEQGFSVNYHDVDPDSGYAWSESVWEYAYLAEDYAKEWAASYEEYWQAQCDCGTSDCGALTLHGIFVQYVRDGWEVDQ
jgi:hypothetical protein